MNQDVNVEACLYNNIMIAGIPFVLAGQLKLIHLIIFIFSNSTRFYVMSGRINSNPTRYDVKAGTFRKNEYKWRYLKSPKLNKDMENNYTI
jgi:hypothetical protein